MTDPLQDPGVQGLAQLGRNAIERVAQLEAELAGYVEANRHMKGELDDALEDARKYAEAQREIARLEDQMACLKEFRMDGLGVDMRWSGDSANALMQMLAAMMLDVPNYLESTLTIAGRGESYVMTIRRHDGKTPHALRAEADAEIARLREALTSLLGAKCWEDDIAASAQARAALAQVAEVGK